MKIIRPLLSVAILALTIFLLYQFVLLPFFYENKAKIVHMIDPDSYVVMLNGELKNIQLIGADAPEKTKVNGKNVKQCYSAEAKQLAAHLFFSDSREVKLESDLKAGNKDDFGRELRYVYLEDGSLLNEELIKNGLAWVYFDGKNEYAKKADFESAQKSAKEKEEGLWKNCE